MVKELPGKNKNKCKKKQKKLSEYKDTGEGGSSRLMCDLFPIPQNEENEPLHPAPSFLCDGDPKSILLAVDMGHAVSFSNSLDRVWFLLLIVLRIPMRRKLSWVQ